MSWRGPALSLAVALLAAGAMLGLVAVRASGQTDYVVPAPAATPTPSTTLTLLGYCDRFGCTPYQQGGTRP